MEEIVLRIESPSAALNTHIINQDRQLHPLSAALRFAYSDNQFRIIHTGQFISSSSSCKLHAVPSLHGGAVIRQCLRQVMCIAFLHSSRCLNIWFAFRLGGRGGGQCSCNGRRNAVATVLGPPRFRGCRLLLSASTFLAIVDGLTCLEIAVFIVGVAAAVMDRQRILSAHLVLQRSKESSLPRVDGKPLLDNHPGSDRGSVCRTIIVRVKP